MGIAPGSIWKTSWGQGSNSDLHAKHVLQCVELSDLLSELPW